MDSRMRSPSRSTTSVFNISFHVIVGSSPAGINRSLWRCRTVRQTSGSGMGQELLHVTNWPFFSFLTKTKYAEHKLEKKTRTHLSTDFIGTAVASKLAFSKDFARHEERRDVVSLRAEGLPSDLDKLLPLWVVQIDGVGRPVHVVGAAYQRERVAVLNAARIAEAVRRQLGTFKKAYV